ncbi:hypothetical protein BH10BAC4_BH10BAC4_20640 [soil metagenome]
MRCDLYAFRSCLPSVGVFTCPRVIFTNRCPSVKNTDHKQKHRPQANPYLAAALDDTLKPDTVGH